MNLTIQIPHGTHSEALYAHAERAIRFALTRFGETVTDVRLRLVDENGPRGGVDQRCRVQVTLAQGGSINLEGASADPFAAIQHVIARVARTVSRRLSRSRR